MGTNRGYVGIATDTRTTYGGNQSLSEVKSIRKCGCGLIAVTDLILYLTGGSIQTRMGIHRFQDISHIPLSKYNALLHELSKQVLMIYPFGINGLSLRRFMNGLLQDNQLPYHAEWILNPTKVEASVTESLLQGLPLLLSIGPSYPLMPTGKKFPLHQVIRNGSSTSRVSAHYAVITGEENDSYIISSWGKRMYTAKSEYLEYALKSGMPYLSGVLVLIPV